MAERLIITQDTGNGRALCAVVRRTPKRVYVRHIRGGDGGLSGWGAEKWTTPKEIAVDGATPELFDTLVNIDQQAGAAYKEAHRRHRAELAAIGEQTRAAILAAILAAQREATHAEVPADS